MYINFRVIFGNWTAAFPLLHGCFPRDDCEGSPPRLDRVVVEKPPSLSLLVHVAHNTYSFSRRIVLYFVFPHL